MPPSEKKLQTPPKGADKQVLYDFMLAGCNRESSFYRDLDTELLTAKAYVENRQWLRRKRSSDPRRAPRVEEIDGAGYVSGEGIPMPVSNEIMPAVDNEVSRLAKRNSETFVDPSDAGDPSSKAAAQVAQDVMTAHLEDMRWPRIRRRAIWRNVQYGTMILRSYLQLDNLDMVRIGLPEGAMRCAGSPGIPAPMDMTGMPMGPDVPGQEPCGCMLASSEIPEAEIGKLPIQALDGLKKTSTFDFNEPNIDAPGGKGKGHVKYEAQSCPQCGFPMEPFVPNEAEARQKDLVGRPLGKDVPKGKAVIEAVSPFDFFPSNEGIGIDPETLEEYWIETARPIDYIKRYFQKNTNLVKSDDAREITRTHPILGEYAADSKGTRGASDRNLYVNYVLLREYVKHPTVEFPKGRYIAMAQNVVLFDGDLIIEPREIEGLEDYRQPKPLKRDVIGIARCFPKDGEIWGMGFPEYARSLQNRINMTDSQIIDTRERHGTDGILATRGMRLTSPGWLKNFIGRVLHWEPDPEAPGQTPIPFPARLMPDGVWKEIESCIDRIQRILGLQDAEIGGVPAPGVTAASAIQFAAEKASERRQQREKELIDCFEEIFRHQLELIQRFYREPRHYKVKNQHGWAFKEFTGSDLRGETGIKIREQPAYDKTMAEREALAAQIQNPMFAPAFQSPYAAREAAKILGLPTGPFEQSNLQMDAAARKWFAFLREEKVPVIDENLDDHFLYYQEYGRLLLSPEGIEAAEVAGWEEVLKAISGWQGRFGPIRQFAMDAQAMGHSMDEHQQHMLEQAQKTLSQMQAVKSPTEAMAAPPVPPTPPPPDILAKYGLPPETLEDQIAWLWALMCKERGVDPQLPRKRDVFMRFRAVYEAHHILAQGDRAQAQAGQPVLPDPAGSTAQGGGATMGEPAVAA